MLYFIRLGFLDGQAGYIYGRLLSQYEYQIGVKLYELQQFGGHLNVKSASQSRSVTHPTPPSDTPGSLVVPTER